MKVLIIKTSSLGDIIHTFPALTDAGKKIPNIEFDWVVEESFATLPRMHPLVKKIIPIAIRRWRKNIFKALFSGEINTFLHELRAEKYDLIIDAQGLIKSGIVTMLSRGVKVGLDKTSLTEPLARFFYQKHLTVDLQKHAVWRMRTIFAQALQYDFTDNELDYNLIVNPQPLENIPTNYIFFAHGTTWQSKHWAPDNWLELAKLISSANYHVCLPWNNDKELVLAQKIASQCANAHVLPKMQLPAIINVIAQATAVITVDTGLGHIAAALNKLSISLYGPTSPHRIGAMGKNQHYLIGREFCVPCGYRVCHHPQVLGTQAVCLQKISAQEVWARLQELINCKDDL